MKAIIRFWYRMRYRLTGEIPPLRNITVELPGEGRWRRFKMIALYFPGDDYPVESVTMLRAKHPEFAEFWAKVDAAA